MKKPPHSDSGATVEQEEAEGLIQPRGKASAVTVWTRTSTPALWWSCPELLPVSRSVDTVAAMRLRNVGADALIDESNVKTVKVERLWRSRGAPHEAGDAIDKLDYVLSVRDSHKTSAERKLLLAVDAVFPPESRPDVPSKVDAAVRATSCWRVRPCPPAAMERRQSDRWEDRARATHAAAQRQEPRRPPRRASPS